MVYFDTRDPKGEFRTTNVRAARNPRSRASVSAVLARAVRELPMAALFIEPYFSLQMHAKLELRTGKVFCAVVREFAIFASFCIHV